MDGDWTDGRDGPPAGCSLGCVEIIFRADTWPGVMIVMSDIIADCFDTFPAVALARCDLHADQLTCHLVIIISTTRIRETQNAPYCVVRFFVRSTMKCVVVVVVVVTVGGSQQLVGADE